MVLMRSLMESAVADAKVSAQSPPCNQNARPAAACAIWLFKSSHSPANTKGGKLFSSFTAAFKSSAAH